MTANKSACPLINRSQFNLLKIWRIQNWWIKENGPSRVLWTL